MTRLDAFDQQLESWLQGEADIPVPTGLHERLFEPTTRRRPRPAVLAWVGSHWVSDVPAGTLSMMRWGRLALVVVVILLVLGAAILVGGGLRQDPLSSLPLVYSRDGDIVMADWDGTNPVVIADGVPSTDRIGTWYALNSWPVNGSVWAPDGSHFVYHELDPWQVPSVTTHISDASGRRLASFVIDQPTPGQTAPPTPAPGAQIGDRRPKLSIWRTWWSPDSTLLATFPWDAETIRIFGVDGRLRHDLPLPDGYGMWREGGLNWAPDGRSVLVVVTSQPGGTDADHERQVWQLPIDGSPARHVSDDHALASWDLRATHDGHRIAFSGHNSPFADGSIFVANGDGSDAHAVTHTEGTGDASYPMWSPDETQLAYMVSRGEGGSWYELRVVDLRTGVDRPVVRAREDGSVNRGWSAGGDRLLFRAYWVEPDIDNLQDQTALWSVRPDGTDLRRLVEGVDSFAAWP